MDNLWCVLIGGWWQFFGLLFSSIRNIIHVGNFDLRSVGGEADFVNFIFEDEGDRAILKFSCAELHTIFDAFDSDG